MNLIINLHTSQAQYCVSDLLKQMTGTYRERNGEKVVMRIRMKFSEIGSTVCSAHRHRLMRSNKELNSCGNY